MTRTRRYFYAGGTNFEQSLDVYFPDSDAPKLDLLVVLIVGSAWCGHMRMIYRGSDRVNSKLPLQVARAGATCVCVRPRGAFPPLPGNVLGYFTFFLLMLIVKGSHAAAEFALGGAAPTTLHLIVAAQVICLAFYEIGVLGALIAVPVIVAVAGYPLPAAAAMVGVLGLWWYSAPGASHEEMVDDGARAVRWVLDHRDRDELGRLGEKRLVFGGYSSGAHVAATLLAHNDDWWKAVDSRPDAHGIRVYGPPRNWCDAALFLSGVFGPLSAAVTAPRTTQRASAATRAGVAGLIAFFLGDEGGRALPSPVAAAQTGEMSRRTVVLGGVGACVLIGCEREFFGVRVLEAGATELLAAHAFEEALRRAGVAVRAVRLPRDNHWTMPASADFLAALRAELPALERQIKK